MPKARHGDRMWRLWRFVDREGRALFEEWLCFASSAISHLLILLAALSIPQGLVWQSVEPVTPKVRVVSFEVQPQILHELEPVLSENDLRAPGAVEASQDVGQINDVHVEGAQQGEPEDEGTKPAGALAGEGRKYVMYCFGCSDCDTNPNHPGCGSSAVEVVGPGSQTLDWSMIAKHALGSCQGLEEGDFVITTGPAGWVSSPSAQGRCVAAHLPAVQNDLWAPSTLRITESTQIDIEW